MKYDLDIFDAVEFDDLRSVKMYWHKDTDVDWQDEKGSNLIMLAAYYGHNKIIEFLLTKKPDLSLRNKKGKDFCNRRSGIFC